MAGMAMTTVMMAAAAGAPAAPLPADFKARADALLARAFEASGPGVSVAISRNGRIVYQGQHGEADVAGKRAIAADTVFRLGSITKQFTAAVVLQLVAEGKLGLSDPLSKVLPDYPNGSAITIRQLLNHTSGVQSYTSIPGWMVEANTARPHSTQQMVAVFRDLPPVAKPGTSWAYNNSGYVLLAAVIEAVTKHPWYEEVDRRIARPLGLRTLRYGGDEARIAAMAKGYTRAEDGAAQPAARIDMSVPSAAGALVGDAADVARWADALHHGRVVPPALYAQMIAPTTLPDGTTVPYGYGLQTSTLRGMPAIGHSGGIFGFASDSLYLPAEDVFVTVLTNSDQPQTSPGGLMRRLAAMAIGKPYPDFVEQPLDVAAVQPFLGTYSVSGKPRILTVEDGRLIYRRPDGVTALVPVGDGRYAFGLDGLTWLDLRRDASGAPTMIVYADGENTDGAAKRTGPVPAAAATIAVPVETLRRYAGSYASPIGKATVALTADATLTVQLAGQPAFAMRAIAPAEFEVEKVGAKVRFIEADGKIARLEIVQGGRTLPATRE